MIWLVGNKGMLGTELANQFQKHTIDFIGTDKEIDITNSDSIADFTSNMNIDYIVNCAAYTAVDKSEDDCDNAYKINSDAVANLVSCAKAKKAVIIHISTDYVFNGKADSPYTEMMDVSPIGVYGKSKEAGERNISSVYDKYFIIRTAWLYGLYGNNFVYTMLRLFKERESLNVVSDQHGTPTNACDLAEFICKIINGKSNQYGIYHYTNEGVTTWYEFANEIKRIAIEKGKVGKDCRINPVSTDQYPTKAERPKYSVLSKNKIKSVFNIKIPQWEESLALFIESIPKKQ